MPLPIDPTTLENDLHAIIRRIRPEVTGEIRSSDRLRDDLGLDSMCSMELLSEISDVYAIDVEVEELQEISTVGDVARFLLAARPSLPPCESSSFIRGSSATRSRTPSCSSMFPLTNISAALGSGSRASRR
jgi:acyl carrier protein